MKKQLAMVLFALLLAVGYAKANGLEKSLKSKGWPFCQFDYVKAYLYNLQGKLHRHHAIIKDHQLDPTVVGRGVILNKRQVNQVVSLTNQNIKVLLLGLSKSYIPHHAFVFYNRSHKPVAYITLCFDCEAMRTSPKITNPKRQSDFSDTMVKDALDILAAYQKIVLELKLPVLKTPFEYMKWGE